MGTQIKHINGKKLIITVFTIMINLHNQLHIHMYLPLDYATSDPYAVQNRHLEGRRREAERKNGSKMFAKCTAGGKGIVFFYFRDLRLQRRAWLHSTLAESSTARSKDTLSGQCGWDSGCKVDERKKQN